MSSGVESAAPPATVAAGADPRRWLALAVVLVAPLLTIFNQFVVNVAIATMQRDLGASFGQIQLVVAVYALAYAVLLITGGRLGDIAGRRKLFLIGLGGFVVGSALCGVAPSAEFLIAARVAQGIGAALVSPQVLAIIRVTFPGPEQSTAFAVYGGVLGIAGVLGQVAGGLLIRADLFGLSWRPIFLINVPIGIAALVAAMLWVPESRPPEARRLDLGGVAIITAGLFLLVFPLVVGRDSGWPAWTLVCLAASLPVIAAFVLFERWLTARGGAPLIDLALFRDRAFTLGLLITTLLFVGNTGYFFALALYLQIGLRYPPLQAGLTFLPDAAAFFVAATLSARLAPKLGSRLLLLGVVCRMAGLLIALLVVRFGGDGVSGWMLAPGLAIQGFGSGSISAPLIAFVLRGIRGSDAGAAAGTLTTAQQVASALGVALIGVLFFSHLVGHADRAAATVLSERQGVFGGVAGAEVRDCLRDRAAGRDQTATPPSCTAPAVLALDPAAVRSAQELATLRNYAAAFVNALAWVLGSLVIACGLVLLLPPVRVAALE
jgi:EmrB/QacA subfamily drug resistance transporter